MANNKTESRNVKQNTDGAAKTTKDNEADVSLFQQVRDICEALVVALFLAFLFKTFEAEAFVIPTGSMAPTLKGRHKDATCRECGFQFQVSASKEIDSRTNSRNDLHVVAGTCPQCALTQFFGDEVPNSRDENAPSFTGDRILVSKLFFDYRDLRRFDVSVFRSPSDPKTNFIKRIVGLPNERLRIQYGDLFVQKLVPGSVSPEGEANSGADDRQTNYGDVWEPDVDLSKTGAAANVVSTVEPSVDGEFVIARKGYDYLRQIMQVVYDADYVSPSLERVGWPERWESEAPDDRGWSIERGKKGRAFCFDVDSTGLRRSSPLTLSAKADVSPVAQDDSERAWLRYRHIVPSSNDWFYLANGELPPEVEASGVVENNPRLIDDFSCYNSEITRSEISPDAWSKNDEFSSLSRHGASSQDVFCAKNPDGLGFNWVGDIGISCELTIGTPQSDSDSLVFDLVKGGVVFRCVLAPKQGVVALDIPQVGDFRTVTAPFDFSKNPRFRFAFFNVDEEMRVVINDSELVFPNDGGKYDRLTSPNAEGVVPLPRDRDPNARDLAPAAIGVRGLRVRVERLKLLRDVYYIAAGSRVEPWDSSEYCDFGEPRCDRLSRKRALGSGNLEVELARFMSSPDQWNGYGQTKSALMTQYDGQYVALGDNSPCSLDSRLWLNVPHYVDRKYLIGKAFFVYWPHGKPLPFVKWPFWPNFEKMRKID